MEEPIIEYVDEFVHTLIEIDPDKLSFFEIRDLCHLVGAPKEYSRYRYLLPEGGLQDDLRAIETDADVVNMTTFYRAWPAEKIIIYTDIDVKPLAVKYPDGGGVADGGVGGDGGGMANDVGGDASGDVGGDEVRDEIDLESDYDEDDENDEEEDVENVEIGARDEEQDVKVSARVEEQNVEGDDDDDDWLNEGLEGDDFGDDIFVAQNSTPQPCAQNSTPQDSAPNTTLESSNAPHIAPKSSNALHVNLEWAELALEDDLVSMDGSDDQQVPEQVKFNAKSDMRNVVLKKEIKFPIAKVFGATLREYAIKKPIDIKFKFNERTKIVVHCKNG